MVGRWYVGLVEYLVGGGWRARHARPSFGDHPLGCAAATDSVRAAQQHEGTEHDQALDR